MKRSFYFILPAIFALNTQSVHALDIDEKLTLRFLKVSSTKKTVLVNRGGEDGLVVGDHAKFFITAGVVARGVAEKVSPSRSVWALYRIVDGSEITQDKALNLKIATPAKITDDPTKSFKDEPIPGGTESMAMNEGGESEETPTEEVTINETDNEELKDLGIEEDRDTKVVATSSRKSKKTTTVKNVTTVEDITPSYSTNTSKTWEVWGTLAVNSLTGTTDDPTAKTESTSVSASNIDFSAGIEKYFFNYNNFLKQVSVSAFIHKKTMESGDTIKTKTDGFEYGLGVNYHFYNSASSVNRLVGFGVGTLGRGSTTTETTTVVNNVSETVPLDGTSGFFSIGLGAKYVLSNGFGVRGVLDYYSSTESYEIGTTDGSVTKTNKLSGPRILFGLSYRF